MCEKECCRHHDDDDDRKQLLRWLLIGVVAFVVAVLFVIFLFWLITRPTKPTFVLQDATLYAFNLSTPAAPTILTSNLQVTISSRNPNHRIGIYYEKLDVYASYQNQQITLSTMLPMTYQGHKDISVWSPFLCGNAVPLSPYLAASLSQDLDTGMVLVNIKVNGKIKWRVGTWISGKYPLDANCPAYISFGENSRGTAFATGAAIKYQLVQGCTVEV